MPKSRQQYLIYDRFCLVGADFKISDLYEGWNFNSGNYLFTTDTK